MEVMEFGGRGEYTTVHIQLWLKVGLIAFLARFHVVKIEVSIIYYWEGHGCTSITSFQKAMVAQASPHSIHLSLECKREIEWKDDTDSSKPIPIQASGGPFGRDYVLR